MSKTKSTVALIRCEDYSPEKVQAAISNGINLLGGFEKFAKKDEKILLKPNILAGESPEKLISPHPEVFRAIAKAFSKTCCSLSYGDSPGFGNPKPNALRAGFGKIADEENIEWADFSNACELKFAEGKVIKKFSIAQGVADADGMISISKLKTHALTRITGAIKNQFGCIPGARKAEFHSVLPTAASFSKMLVDLTRLLKPRLYIMDGIIAMEGNGPRNGTPRQMNVLLFSIDPVALDSTVCKLINLDPMLVESLVYGEEFGLGTCSEIDFIGDAIEEFVVSDFVVNRNPKKTTPGSSYLSTSFLRRFSAPRPTIKPEICTKCGRCVEVCPAQPKALSWGEGDKTTPPVYDYSKCIRCYCCQEMCPFNAIYVKIPPLGKLIRS
jgi:uncharacterized protein (DUF362 family)/NAD-dependent dihydropyrimidine dehydrogenase PreA subunit